MLTVVHFEIPADDVERAQKFYGELFGWKIEKFTGPMPMDYWMITTGAKAGEMGLDGGMMKRQAPQISRLLFILMCRPSMNTWTRSRSLAARCAFPKPPYPEWDTSQCVSIRKITALVFGRNNPKRPITLVSLVFRKPCFDARKYETKKVCSGQTGIA